MTRVFRALLISAFLIASGPVAIGQDCELKSALARILNDPAIDSKGMVLLEGQDVVIEPIRVALQGRGISEHSNTVTLVRVGESRARFVFKPAAGEDYELLNDLTPGKRGSLGVREVIAFGVDRKLGLGRVPEALPAVVNGQPGVAIEYIEGNTWIRTFANRMEADLVASRNEAVAKAFEEQILFDFLMGNIDRRISSKASSTGYEVNGGNWIFIKNPNGGVVDAKFIDNGLALSSRYATKSVLGPAETEAYAKGTMRNLTPLLPERASRTDFVVKLAGVDENNWRLFFRPYETAGYITVEDVNGFLTRRRYLLNRYSVKK